VLEEEVGKVVARMEVELEARPLEGGPEEKGLSYRETGPGGQEKS